MSLEAIYHLVLLPIIGLLHLVFPLLAIPTIDPSIISMLHIVSKHTPEHLIQREQEDAVNFSPIYEHCYFAFNFNTLFSSHSCIFIFG